MPNDYGYECPHCGCKDLPSLFHPNQWPGWGSWLYDEIYGERAFTQDRRIIFKLSLYRVFMCPDCQESVS